VLIDTEVRGGTTPGIHRGYLAGAHWSAHRPRHRWWVHRQGLGWTWL